MNRRQGTILIASLALLLGSGLRPLVGADSLRVREERAIKAALARVAPSVVRIETVGGAERIGQLLVGTGPTTGLIVSSEGYIVSSAYNFIQKPSSILVTLEGGSRHAAKIVASDRSRMIVLLKIDADAKLTVPEVAPQAEVRVGQWALAVGRTFEASQPNASVGIVSALARVWGKAIQTDAKISPNNYGGPLIDIAGRVLGVLVPMSPDSTGELAGIEWYDSGIGFAIPLEDLMRVLPKLQQGQDLQPGLLGINVKGADLYSQPAMIGAARATGPAYKAGFRAGDKIVEAGGVPVTRPAELKQRLGSMYAGETIRIVALRGETRVEHDVNLADKIDPYEFPFLGVLPMRFAKAAPQAGVKVRYVYPDSPAAAAGIKPGDRITKFTDQEIASADALAQALVELAPDQTAKLEIERDGQKVSLEAKLGRLPDGLPGPLPAARNELPAFQGERPPVGVVPLKIPEFANECIAYVPENYHPDVAYGVVLWLHAPGGFKQEELVERWKPFCERHDLILVAPKSSDSAAWRPTEVRFVRRVLDEVIKRYSTDPARIVVHGHEGGGALAYVIGLSSPEVVRGIAAVDAPLPRMVQPPETDPVHRLAIYTTHAAASEQAAAVEAGIKRLTELKYPLVVKNIDAAGRYLTPDELDELVRWFDSLDRL